MVMVGVNDSSQIQVVWLGLRGASHLALFSVKIVPDVTYNVFGVTLNLAQSIHISQTVICSEAGS